MFSWYLSFGNLFSKIPVWLTLRYSFRKLGKAAVRIQTIWKSNLVFFWQLGTVSKITESILHHLGSKVALAPQNKIQPITSSFLIFKKKPRGMSDNAPRKNYINLLQGGKTWRISTTASCSHTEPLETNKQAKDAFRARIRRTRSSFWSPLLSGFSVSSSQRSRCQLLGLM